MKDRIFEIFELQREIQRHGWLSQFSLAFFAIYGYSTNSQRDQLQGSFIAQLVEHCTGIAEVMGSNPVQAKFVFRL